MAAGPRFNEHGRRVYSVRVNGPFEVEPANARAAADQVHVQLAMQTILRDYGAGLLSLPSRGELPKTTRALAVWLLPEEEKDPAEARAERDGLTFPAAVRHLLTAYGDGMIDIRVDVVD